MKEVVYSGRVMGISMSPAKENFAEIIKKFNMTPIDKIEPTVQLVAEPDNVYDPNAILVMFGNKGETLKKVGYIPKENTHLIHQAGIDTLTVSIVKLNKMDNKVVGLDIIVGRP